MAGIILLPRFLNPSANSIGTMSILLFWVAILSMSSDYVVDFESSSVSFSEYFLFTRSILLVLLLISILTIYWGEIVFEKNANLFAITIRRMLYLCNPLLCLAWLPNVVSSKRLEYCKFIAILTSGMAAVIYIPNILNQTSGIIFLNEMTAHLSSGFFGPFSDLELSVKKTFFNNGYYCFIISRDFSVVVGDRCGSLPQILISLYALTIFFLNCKIRSLSNLVLISFTAILITFLLNTFRISMLVFLVSRKNMASFDFWHEGIGSMIFSFICMTIVCFLYYWIWERENKSK